MLSIKSPESLVMPSVNDDIIFLPNTVNVLPKSSYLTSFIFSKASEVELISPFKLLIANTPLAPKSSHIVPNKFTPAVFCSIGSFISFKAFIVSVKASFASLPPFENFFAIESAFNPAILNAVTVVSLPSITLIPNSFIVSPNLSTLNVPLLAPFSNILNISSALKPSCLKCTEYSLIVSNKSSFLFNPF